MKNIIILGASGAAGGQALARLQNMASIDKISLVNLRIMKTQWEQEKKS
jgi:N-acetyl-gamma-glutamylphosphate reductase